MTTNWLTMAAVVAAAVALQAAPDGTDVPAFVERHCADCHDAETKKGGLDLMTLKLDVNDPQTFATWVKVHDRVQDHEMPPKKKQQPGAAEAEAFLKAIAKPLSAVDRERAAAEGRATWRRLNRYEYENTLRDLLDAPWLQIKEMLPEDGEAYRFNKVGDALDVSHVQMVRYLGAAEYALREVMATQAQRPKTPVRRYYAREQPGFARRVNYTVFNRSPERATFPILGTEADVAALEGRAPLTVGASDPAKRELEAMGVVASTYEPLEIKFDGFTAPAAGRYRLRFNAFSFWAGPESEAKWWKPDRKNASAGRTREPVTIYSETPPRLLRRIGGFEVTPEPSVQELDVWLVKGETIRPDAARLFRSRPSNYHNPLAEKDGQPGVAFRWMEVEGPIYDQWPTAGHKLLFGNLPVKQSAAGKGHAGVVSKKPKADSERLLRAFMQRAYRRPVAEEDVRRFLKVIHGALDSGGTFTDAMIAGYSAVLCSPAFVCLDKRGSPGFAPGTRPDPGDRTSGLRLDDFALAERLSYFLWNSEPDETLRAIAARGELRKPDVLLAQTGRLLNDPKSQRFVEAFLDYWLDLRKATATSPDAALYPDYYLDDFLVESAVEETRLFFAELLRRDLPGRNVVAADFAMLNERLATHYGLFTDNAEATGEGESGPANDAPASVHRKPLVAGSALRRVALPPDSPRGGLLTQASVLKVTANGTTTSPVLRGAWIMERILGKPVPPPPATVPAVEPDIRGATTIREQLDKHRTIESCNVCHSKMDPAGFALESFDVLGGWRDRYRALGDGEKEIGYGKNGLPFAFHKAQAVDASGALPDGRGFQDIRDLKRLLLADERQIARNLTRQLVVYAIGAPVCFGDRPEIETILDATRPSQYGVRSLIVAIVQSELFQNK